MMIVSVHLGSFRFRLHKMQGKTAGFQSSRMIDKKALGKARIKLTDQSSLKLILGVRQVDKMDRFGLSDPFLVLYKKGADGSKTQLYETEVSETESRESTPPTSPSERTSDRTYQVHHKTLNASFKEFEISAAGLLDDEHIYVECYDWNQVSSRDFIGATEFTVSQLLSIKDFELINPSKQRKKNYRNSGRLVVASVKPVNAKVRWTPPPRLTSAAGRVGRSSRPRQ